MPNRIIKDTIRTSRSVNALTDFQFRVWLYLITYVDDYGRGSADAELLKGLVFTRRKGVTEQQIQKAIADLANMGMVNLYEVDGEPFLYFPNWHDHQRIRDCKPKFPAPPENESCGELRQAAASCGELPPESESNICTSTSINTNDVSKALSNTEALVSNEEFNTFWAAYPKKNAKLNAQKAFAKVDVPLNVLLDALERQKASWDWQKEGGKYIPLPATWLNGRRWEDEDIAAPQPSPRPNKPYTKADELTDFYRMAQEWAEEG